MPIRFEEVSRVKKPSRKAKPEAWKEYKEAIKQHNLSQSFVGMMGQLRQELDLAGGEKKILVLAGDGSFCNRTCFRARRDRAELICRTRKDAVLCWGATEGRRRFYGTEKFTLSDHPNPANDDHPKTGQRRTTIRVAFSDRLD